MSRLGTMGVFDIQPKSNGPSYMTPYNGFFFNILYDILSLQYAFTNVLVIFSIRKLSCQRSLKKN